MVAEDERGRLLVAPYPQEPSALFVGVELKDKSLSAVKSFRDVLQTFEEYVLTKGVDTLFATVNSRRNKRWTEFFGFKELTPGIMVKDIE